jgi:hypothetical protein
METSFTVAAVKASQEFSINQIFFRSGLKLWLCPLAQRRIQTYSRA